MLPINRTGVAIIARREPRCVPGEPPKGGRTNTRRIQSPRKNGRPRSCQNATMARNGPPSSALTRERRALIEAALADGAPVFVAAAAARRTAPLQSHAGSRTGGSPGDLSGRSATEPPEEVGRGGRRRGDPEGARGGDRSGGPQSNWKAAAWLLTKRWPSRYGASDDALDWGRGSSAASTSPGRWCPPTRSPTSSSRLETRSTGSDGPSPRSELVAARRRGSVTTAGARAPSPRRRPERALEPSEPPRTLDGHERGHERLPASEGQSSRITLDEGARRQAAEPPRPERGLVSQGARSERARPVVTADDWLRSGLRRDSIWEEIA